MEDSSCGLVYEVILTLHAPIRFDKAYSALRGYAALVWAGRICHYSHFQSQPRAKDPFALVQMPPCLPQRLVAMQLCRVTQIRRHSATTITSLCRKTISSAPKVQARKEN